jgi:hypothetical protein
MDDDDDDDDDGELRPRKGYDDERAWSPFPSSSSQKPGARTAQSPSRPHRHGSDENGADAGETEAEARERDSKAAKIQAAVRGRQERRRLREQLAQQQTEKERRGLAKPREMQPGEEGSSLPGAGTAGAEAARTPDRAEREELKRKIAEKKEAEAAYRRRTGESSSQLPVPGAEPDANAAPGSANKETADTGAAGASSASASLGVVLLSLTVSGLQREETFGTPDPYVVVSTRNAASEWVEAARTQAALRCKDAEFAELIIPGEAWAHSPYTVLSVFDADLGSHQRIGITAPVTIVGLAKWPLHVDLSRAPVAGSVGKVGVARSTVPDALLKKWERVVRSKESSSSASAAKRKSSLSVLTAPPSSSSSSLLANGTTSADGMPVPPSPNVRPQSPSVRPGSPASSSQTHAEFEIAARSLPVTSSVSTYLRIMVRASSKSQRMECVHRSPVVRDSAEPDYAPFALPLAAAARMGPGCVVELWDCSSSGKDVLLGSVATTLLALSSTAQIALEGGGGEIVVRKCVVPDQALSAVNGSMGGIGKPMSPVPVSSAAAHSGTAGTDLAQPKVANIYICIIFHFQRIMFSTNFLFFFFFFSNFFQFFLGERGFEQAPPAAAVRSR